MYWNKNHKAGNRSRRIFKLIQARILISLQSTAPGSEIKGNSERLSKFIVACYSWVIVSSRHFNLASIVCMNNSNMCKYILDKTNIFLRQIALLSFKLGGTMKDKHVENWLTSSKCFCLSLITLQNGSLTSLSQLTKNQIGKTRHRLIILEEKINEELDISCLFQI